MRYQSYLVAVLTAVSLVPAPVDAAPFKIKVKLPLSGVDSVNAISKSGKVFAGKRIGSTVTISVPPNLIGGTSLYGTNEGTLVGPIFAKKGQKGLLAFVKAPKDPQNNKLSPLNLSVLAPEAGAAALRFKSVPKGNVFDARYKYDIDEIPALGIQLADGELNPKPIQGDSDGDGVVDSLDVDVDGDGVLNIADAASAGESSIGIRADGPDVPFTALFLPMSQTINWHIGGTLDQSSVDAVIGGENKFSIAFFFTFPPGGTTSGITGGHVVCDSSLPYCRPSSDGSTGTAVYSGFSEGNQSLAGQLWSSIATDGNEYSLEQFSVGGSTDTVYAASVQPRVGTASFSPGNVYRVDFTNSTGATVTSSTLTLPPYFVTVPAIKAFSVAASDGSADTTVNYSDSSGEGMNNSNPIVLANSGPMNGKLRLAFWRLQRLAVSPTESGTVRDFGRLNYGVTIQNNSGEFTCGGLYSGLSSSLTEGSYLGDGGSFSTQNGAVLWPLTDSTDDFEPTNGVDTESLARELVTFTVDLAACLDRNGLNPGTHQINLFAAGASTRHGANRAAQMIHVNIP